MKKLLLSVSLAFLATSFMSAQTVHKLDIAGLYNQILEGITAGTETATYNSGSTTKILLNTDRTQDIFTLVSPSGRTLRMDVDDTTYGNGEVTTARLETNGASNATNGRKIYIDCPVAGTLKLGVYNGDVKQARGYTIENAAGTILFDSEAALVAQEAGFVHPIYEYVIAEAGRIVINPNAGIYYGVIEFVAQEGQSLTLESADKTVASVEYYDVTGRKVAKGTQGLMLQKTAYTDGTTKTVKTVVK